MNNTGILTDLSAVEFVDLHNHSKYSRATSELMDLEHQAFYAKKKGLTVLGTSDFTHPRWLKELKDKLVSEGNGLYSFKGLRFVLTTEISNIYSVPNPKNGVRVKKIHHVLVAPSFEVVDQINELLSSKGRLDYDGRPIFGGYTSEEFAADPYLWIRMVVEWDHEIVRKQIEEVRKGCLPQSIEHRIVRKDGIIRWVDSTIVPAYDADGNLISYDGIIRDINNNSKTFV